MSVIMTTDHWEGVFNNEEVNYSPSWEMVDDAIQRLDERVYTSVALYNQEGLTLSIGGGPAGIVILLNKEDDYLTARRSDETEKTMILIGGQSGEYMRKYVFSREGSKKIAKAFFEGRDVRNMWVWES